MKLVHIHTQIINSVLNCNDNAAIYSTHYTGHVMSLNIVLKQIRFIL